MVRIESDKLNKIGQFYCENINNDQSQTSFNL